MGIWIAGVMMGAILMLILAVGFVVARQRIVYRGECNERMRRYVSDGR